MKAGAVIDGAFAAATTWIVDVAAADATAAWLTSFTDTCSVPIGPALSSTKVRVPSAESCPAAPPALTIPP